MLKIINCDDCGACCAEMNTPPGYSAVLFNPTFWPAEYGDHERVASLPLDAKQAILDKLDNPDADEVCCWLDMQTLQCRWYDHRPQICRDFERGGESCRVWRAEFNVDVVTIRQR